MDAGELERLKGFIREQRARVEAEGKDLPDWDEGHDHLAGEGHMLILVEEHFGLLN